MLFLNMIFLIHRLTSVLGSLPCDRSIRTCRKFLLWKSVSYAASSPIHTDQHTECSNDDEFDLRSLDLEPSENSTNSKEMKVLQLQIDLWRQMGVKLPEKMSKYQLATLKAYESDDMKMKYLNGLWIQENRRIHLKKVKALAFEKFQEFKSKRPKPEVFTTKTLPEYALAQNSLFHRLRDGQIERFYDYALLKAASYGLPMIVDCGFEGRRLKPIAKQIEVIYLANKHSTSPFNLIFSNFDERGELVNKLRDHWKRFDDPCHPFQYTIENFTNLFPIEKLVYISPSAKRPLTKFNHNDIYVIPATMSGTTNVEIVSKIKQHEMRSARFPLREMKVFNGYFPYSANMIFNVLSDLRENDDWEHALRFLRRSNKHIEDGGVWRHDFCEPQRQEDVYNLLLKNKKYYTLKTR